MQSPTRKNLRTPFGMQHMFVVYLGRTQDSWFSSLDTISRLNILWRSYKNRSSTALCESIPSQCWGSRHENGVFFGSSLEQGGRQQRKLHRHPSHLGTLVCSSLKPCAAWCTIFTSNLDNLDNLGSVWFCFYSLETIRHCKLSISPRSLSISNTLPSQSPSRKSESQLSRERHFDVKCIEMWCGPWSTLQKIGPVSQDHYGIKMIKWLRL